MYFLVEKNLMDGGAGPQAVEIGAVPVGVQGFRDFAFRAALIDEHLVHPLCFLGARHQNNAVRLEALLLAAGKLALRVAVLVDQHPSEPGPPDQSRV